MILCAPSLWHGKQVRVENRSQFQSCYRPLLLLLANKMAQLDPLPDLKRLLPIIGWHKRHRCVFLSDCRDHRAIGRSASFDVVLTQVNQISPKVHPPCLASQAHLPASATSATCPSSVLLVPLASLRQTYAHHGIPRRNLGELLHAGDKVLAVSAVLPARLQHGGAQLQQLESGQTG